MGIPNLLKIMSRKNEALEEELNQAYTRIEQLEAENIEMGRQLSMAHCALNENLVHARELLYD